MLKFFGLFCGGALLGAAAQSGAVGYGKYLAEKSPSA
jgi:hypothetical protein